MRGKTAKVDISVKDFLDIATSGNAMGAAGDFALRYDRLGLYTDSFGGPMGSGGVTF